MDTMGQDQAGGARVLAVLGMHRSGTSMLTGTLQEAGVFLGKVFRDPIEHNRKGLLEPKAVLYMHEDLFRANGGSWRDPPMSPRWQPLHVAVRDLFIDSMADRPLWAFKDPRTLFTLKDWQAVVPGLQPVGIFRHPLAVAESLRRRNALPIEEGLGIWQRYNEQLLSIHGADPFPVIEFRPDPRALREDLARLVATLGLPVQPDPAAFEFFDERIPAAPPPGEVPEAAAALYDRLRAIAL